MVVDSTLFVSDKYYINMLLINSLEDEFLKFFYEKNMSFSIFEHFFRNLLLLLFLYFQWFDCF